MNTSTTMKSLSTRLLLIISMVVIFGGWQVARAATTITVDTNNTGTNVSGSCALRDALQIAAGGSVAGSTCATGSAPYTINLQANTTYNLTAVDNTVIGGVPTGLPTIVSAVTIEGNRATIQRDPSAPQFRLLGVLGGTGSLTLDNLTLSGGVTIGAGGAISNAGPVMINGCTITNNSAASGGAIGAFGPVSINNSTISNNNSSNSGGGIVTLGNFVSISMTNSTIANNSSPDGGGITLLGTPISLSIANSTIAYNTSSSGGSDNISIPIAIAGLLTSFDHAILVTSTGRTNCLVNGLQGGITASYSLASDASCGFANGVNNNIVTTTPGLAAALADNGGPTQTIALLSGPGINGGGTCSVTSDQRGALRPGISGTGIKPACDIGAYETGDPRINLVTPSSGTLNFGQVTNGSSSTQMVEIQNSGNSDLTLSSVSLAIGPGFSTNFTLTSPVLTPVKAQNYRDFSVTYTPNANTTDSGELDIASNSATNNPLKVNLTGTGVGFTIPPIQQIQDILSFLSTHGQPTGCLIALGPNSKAASGKYNAFVNMINSAGSLITAGQDTKACSQLADAEKKVDGQPNPPDFIGGSCAPQLDNMIINLMNTLPGCSFPQP